jgi:hypothetical protein
MDKKERNNMEIISGKIVKHEKTGAVETIVDKCKIKINGEWVDGIIYKGIDRHTGNPMTFVRELNDFNENFVDYKMTVEELRKEIYSHEKPKGWREGQFVFNMVNKLYDVARDVQFDYGVDCYYDDNQIDVFLIKSVEVINYYSK